VGRNASPAGAIYLTITIMKTTAHPIIYLSVLCALAISFLSAGIRAADLSPSDKQFLAGYEQIQTALAADDLSGARKAAASLAVSGTDLAKSQTLEQARAAFEKLSEKAIKLASGRPGFHVFHCSMANKDWVQTSTAGANPYLGKEMAGCGEIKP
jgi:hypothetical protein